MTYDIKDLPYSQFEQIGLSKKEVINMKTDDLSNMLSGNRTGLIPLKIPLGEGMQPLQTEAKLSLQRNPDNTLSLGIHPILAKATNNIEATPQQWEKMLKGEPIVKDTKSWNGQMEPHVHQLDRDTKEILSARVANIQIPNAINNQVLDQSQKEQLKSGMPLVLENNGKEMTTARLDLNEPKGLKIATEQLSLDQSTKLANTQDATTRRFETPTLEATQKQDAKESMGQQKTVVETPSVSAGQKVDNNGHTAFIVNFHPKEQPQLKDTYLARNNDDVYLRVSHLVKDNEIKVEKFTGLNDNELKAMHQKPRDHYEGKGTLVLQSNENGKGVVIKEDTLKATFDKNNSLQPASAVKVEIASAKESASVSKAVSAMPETSESPSRGFKR